MAESYAVPGKTCDVGTIKSQFPALDDTRGWNAFCDCMFLEPTLKEQVYLDGTLLAIPGGLTTQQARADYVQYAAKQAKLQNPARGNVVLKEEVTLQRTEQWEKCVSNFCSVPWGCPHPTIPGFTMPFNISPFAGSPPWTELGAAARGIKKRDAGFFYTVGQIITIDVKDYAPLNMWRNMFINPALYNLHVLKLGMIPGIGPGLVAKLSTLETIQFHAGTTFVPKSVIVLGPLALAQCAAEQKSVLEYVIKPAITGGAKSVALLLQIAGPALSQQYFAVAGITLERFAKDQIESGEINKVLDPFTNGTIRFFAESGSRIGSELQAAIGSGFDLKSTPGIMRTFEAGFRAVARSPEVKDDLARAILNTTADVFGIIAIIAEGFGPKYERLSPLDRAFAIADDVFYTLFGFRLGELKVAVTKGTAEVNTLLDVARRKGKTVTLESLSESLNAIIKAFEKVVSIINDISKRLDGALDNLTAQFSSFNQVLTSVRSDTQAAYVAASAGKTAALTAGQAPVAFVAPLPAQVLMRTATMATPPRQVQTVQLPTPQTQQSKPPAPKTPQAKPGGATPLVTAGLGFAVGGPPGAVAGLLVGAVLGSKK